MYFTYAEYVIHYIIKSICEASKEYGLLYKMTGMGSNLFGQR